MTKNPRKVKITLLLNEEKIKQVDETSASLINEILTDVTPVFVSHERVAVKAAMAECHTFEYTVDVADEDDDREADCRSR